MKVEDRKTSEYSVGDWITHKGIPTQIDLIGKSTLNLGIETEDGSETALWKDIEPIPITPRILEKNGFRKGVHNCSLYYDWRNLDGDDVTLRKYPCGYFELHITDNENLRNVRFPIDYVHELQHALRLCKIDKEIKL